MPKVAAALTELKETDVTHVSLVKNAATRIPFRVIKHSLENDMGSINLSAIGRVFKTNSGKPAVEPKGTQVLAVVVNGLDASLQEAVVKSLGASGFDFKTVTVDEEGGTTSFSGEGELPKEGTSLIRLSEDVVMVVKGFCPWGDDMSKAPFADQAAAQGFYSGIQTAADLMAGVVVKSLYDASSKADSLNAIKKSLGEFTNYVEGLVNGLPELAFKAEAEVQKIVTTFKAEAEAAAKKAPPAKGKDEKDTVPEGADADDWAKMDDDAKAAWKAKQKSAKKSEAAPNVELAALTQAMGDLAAKFGEFAEKTVKSQESTEKKLEEVARKAEDASKALKSTVIAAAKPGDNPAGAEGTKKTDNDPRSGAFDSAYIPRRVA